jgi:hypothetical protein
MEQAARALLQRALAWHERNPDRRPVVRFPIEGSQPVCEFKITELHLAAQNTDGHWHVVGGILKGPTTGGTPLALVGVGIDDPTEARIAGVSVKPVESSANPDTLKVTVIVLTPKVDTPQSASIHLRNRAGELAAPVTFQYE